MIRLCMTVCVGLLSVLPGKDTPPEEMLRLVAAYPECLVGMKDANILIWKDGTEMLCDDGIVKKDYEDLLNRACLKDQMSMEYPAGWPTKTPLSNQDPGRVRCEAFFRKMYGDSEEQVRTNLTSVVWLENQRLSFSSVNRAATALEKVCEEIRGLPTETQVYVSHPIGTFNWRTIEGVPRLSMHSFGIAIDFKLPQSKTRYWRDAMKKGTDKPRYPSEILEDKRLGVIVSTFEKYGFIWGGKWDHYDTMHFEYRPELFHQNR